MQKKKKKQGDKTLPRYTPFRVNDKCAHEHPPPLSRRRRSAHSRCIIPSHRGREKGVFDVRL